MRRALSIAGVTMVSGSVTNSFNLGFRSEDGGKQNDIELNYEYSYVDQRKDCNKTYFH